MKILVAFFVLIFSTIVSFSQIVLENTYSYSTSVCNLNEQDYFYYLMDVPQEQCRIYNSNHELYKNINLIVPDGYYLSDIKFVTKNLFNTDDLIELVYLYEKYVIIESGYYVQYGLSVINENGSQLLVLPNGGWADIKKVEDENKLLAYSYIYNPAGYYDVMTNVYALGGDLNYVNLIKTESIIAFPNPTTDFIILNSKSVSELVNGEFNLYTISGQKVLSAAIEANQEFRLPINHLESGAYLYTVTDDGKLIQSKKIIIN